MFNAIEIYKNQANICHVSFYSATINTFEIESFENRVIDVMFNAIEIYKNQANICWVSFKSARIKTFEIES